MFPETLTATRNSRCVANPPRLPARARCLHVPRTPDSFRHPLLSLVDVLTDYSDSFSHAQQQGYYYQDARQQGQGPHQYSDSGGYPSHQAYQQQLAYAGMQQSASQPYWYSAPYGEGGEQRRRAGERPGGRRGGSRPGRQDPT